MSNSPSPPVAAAQSWTTSNVRVVSNVFPIDDRHVNRREMPGITTVIDGIFEDKNFRLQVRGKEALKKLASHKITLGNDMRQMRQDLTGYGVWEDQQGKDRWIEEWQIDLYLRAYGSGRCVDCPKGARPIGMGWGAANSRIEIRCDITKCPCR